MLGRGGVANAGGTLEDVLLELIGAVVDALGSLRAGQRAVDAARGFGGVPSQERAFVQQKHPSPVLQNRVRRGQAGESASYDDDLVGHCRGLSSECVFGGGGRCFVVLFHRTAAWARARAKG